MIFRQAPVDKVLLIDNDEDDRTLFAAGLREAATDVQLLEAQDFAGMTTLLRTQLPDLIFIDINMPGADGFDCLEYLQRNVLYRTIPVVMHSSAGNPTQIAKAYSMGAHLYFRKPYHFAVYVMGLRKVLSLDWMHPERVQHNHLREGFRMFNPAL
jgi:CheY-like chemotaxis protein